MLENDSANIECVGSKKKICTRCSPSRVYDVVSRLNKDMKELVKEMGFGTFLSMKKCSIRRELIQWMVERFDPVKGTIKLNNREIVLNSETFGKIIGIRDGGEDFGDISREESYNIGGSTDRISLNKLQNTLLNSEDTESFVLNFVLYVAGSFLMPTTSLNVVRNLEVSLIEIKSAQSAKSKNWASMSWRFLVQSIHRFKQRRSQFLCGCIFFFQLYYFNEIEGYDRYVDKSICPISWWSEAETKAMFRWINQRGGFDNAQNNFDGTADNESRLLIGLSSTTEVVEHLCSEVGEMKSQLTGQHGELKGFIKTELEKAVEQAMTNMNNKFSSVAECNSSSVITNANCVSGFKEVPSLPSEPDLYDNIKDVRLTNVVTSTDMGVESSATMMYKQYVKSLNRVVGPFRINSGINITIFSLAMYIFDTKISMSEVLFRYKNHEVIRLYFCGLLPQSKVDFQLLAAYVLMIRSEEILKFKVGQRACVVTMPIRKKNGSYVDSNVIVQTSTDEVPLHRSAKVILPILDLDEGHWLMAEFNRNEQVCSMWDSLDCGRQKIVRWKQLRELGAMLDECNHIGSKMFSEDYVKFQDYAITNTECIPTQNNGFDCGVFVMKYMRESVKCLSQSSNKVGLLQFDPCEERLHIAIEIVSSVFNEVSADIASASKMVFCKNTSENDNSPTTLRPLNRLRNPVPSPVIPSLATKKQRTAYWNRVCKRKILRSEYM